MAKNKYTDDFPLLVEGFAREGLNDTEIAGKLGIATSTYYDYQNKHTEFSDAIKRGKAPVDVKVENALLKRALGYSYEEKHSEVKINEKGEAKVIGIKTVTKNVPPDVGAQVFWLTNRKKHNWRNTQHIDHTTKDESMNSNAEELRQIYEDIKSGCEPSKS